MAVTTLAEALLKGILLGGLYAVTALGLSMVFNVSRLVNLAHGEFLILGAYISFVLSTALGIDPFISVVISAVIFFLIGYSLQGFMLNPVMGRGAVPPLMTAFGLSIVAQGLYGIFWSGESREIINGYSQTYLTLAGLDIPVIYVVSFGLSIVVIAGIHLFMMNTFIGKAVRAVAQDHETALTRGINVKSVYCLTCAIGAATAALGGTLIGMTFSFSPSSGLPWLLKAFAIVLLGGRGNIFRVLAGGLILGASEGIGVAIIGEGYRDLIALFILLAILVYKPAGLFKRAGLD